jgi:nitrite reductase (cytochrome c-552)
MDALMDLIADIKAAVEAGVPEAKLVEARDFQRKATFYLDFVEAENSTGFHAPQESVRILGESIDFSRRGQQALRPEGFRGATAFAEPPPLLRSE